MRYAKARSVSAQSRRWFYVVPKRLPEPRATTEAPRISAEFFHFPSCDSFLPPDHSKLISSF
jgi:hypothetical protein